MEIPDSGERIILEKETPLMIARHFCAYKFAKGRVFNKTVMDVGCGEGYGSFYLSEFAKKVIGIDYNKKIIDYAKNKYHRDNLFFYTFDAKELSSFNDRFDVICSFQVIEHIRYAKQFLENIKSLLNEKGIFICSTPNKLDASPNSDIPLNKFHVKEYLLNEFKELLELYFREVAVFGLKRGWILNFYRRLKKIGLLNFLPESINPVCRFYDQIGCEDFIIKKNNIESALDFIGVCKKQK